MSKAVICDCCKKAVTEQSAHHIEMKHAFITTYYDLCAACAKRFHEEFMRDWKKNMTNVPDTDVGEMEGE